MIVKDKGGDSPDRSRRACQLGERGKQMEVREASNRGKGRY
jgi:hypothetical protein